jgi:hypothetical protein
MRAGLNRERGNEVMGLNAKKRNVKRRTGDRDLALMFSVMTTRTVFRSRD